MPNLFSVKRLPSAGKPGDVYFQNVEKEFYIVLTDSTLLPVSGMLNPNPRGIVGPQGERGPVGATGPQGPQGIAGQNGADSTAVGPQGPIGPRGIAGVHGQNGKDGRDGIDGKPGRDGRDGVDGRPGRDGSVVYPTDNQPAVANQELLQQRARTQAAFLQAMLDTNQKVGSNLLTTVNRHVRQRLEKIKREAGL